MAVRRSYHEPAAEPARQEPVVLEAVRQSKRSSVYVVLRPGEAPLARRPRPLDLPQARRYPSLALMVVLCAVSLIVVFEWLSPRQPLVLGATAAQPAISAAFSPAQPIVDTAHPEPSR